MERREFLKSGAAVLALSASGKSLAKAGQLGAVTFDERSVTVRGRRLLVSSGEIHYARSTRAMWPALLQRSKALGLNTIATYLFWNFHETRRGVYDFTGDRDLGHFLDLCQEHKLGVFLRPGPYICAEWNFGGYPPYLRDEPGITIRTLNKPYTDRVEEYYRRIAEVVRPRLASNGGPIMLVQVENEYANVAKRYGEAGQQYLRWIVELAHRVGLDGVPTTMCEGGAQGAIETSNGFTISAERIDAVRKAHPGTPLLWTELYPSWYRVWGGRIAPARDPRSIAGAILDFVSRGGSGWNYYMWHGGSNFGRNSMYLQTPTYDFYAPLDEYGRPSIAGDYLGRFHGVLDEHSSILLEGIRAESVTATVRTTTWRSGQDELRLIQEGYGEEKTEGNPFTRPSTRALLVNGKGDTLFDLDAVQAQVTRAFIAPAWKAVARPTEWLRWNEPLPAERVDRGTVAEQPVEQLLLTRDATDYCWYSAALEVAEGGAKESTLVIPYGGDFFYVYLDGKLAASSKLPLEEDRGAITPEDPAHPRAVANVSERDKEHGFRHTFTLPALEAGTHRLDLLATALGMIKGDWMIASPMNYERKGIWEGVEWGGGPLRGWTMRAGLAGEAAGLSSGSEGTAWQAGKETRPLRWFKARMDVPLNLLGGSAVFRIDAAGLGKGMIWVNGKGLGRHWLIEAASPPHTPSQRYYHVPADWLKASNQVVILEEQAAFPATVELQARL